MRGLAGGAGRGQDAWRPGLFLPTGLPLCRLPRAPACITHRTSDPGGVVLGGGVWSSSATHVWSRV